MLRLVGHPRSRAMRVLWMLEELGESCDYDPALPRSETAFAVNDAGKIPVLVVDGEAITDSVAIVQYLADRAGALTAPAGTLARARQDSFTQFCVDEIEGALWTAGKHSFALPEALRVPAVKETCRAEFARAMETLERRLGDAPFVTGDAFTVPDLLLGHCAGWAESAKFDLPGGSVGAYLGRVRARPALAAAMNRGAAAIAA
ncbi:glutathione S-transferase family protein [Rubrimonas cliftonensis]|nr:glutathione S-transferase family protein [Rubrimonas cliftonensis]